MRSRLLLGSPFGCRFRQIRQLFLRLVQLLACDCNPKLTARIVGSLLQNFHSLLLHRGLRYFFELQFRLQVSLEYLSMTASKLMILGNSIGIR